MSSYYRLVGPDGKGGVEEVILWNTDRPTEEEFKSAVRATVAKLSERVKGTLTVHQIVGDLVYRHYLEAQVRIFTCDLRTQGLLWRPVEPPALPAPPDEPENLPEAEAGEDTTVEVDHGTE